MLDIFWGILGIIFLGYIINLFVEDRKKTKIENEIGQKKWEEEKNYFQEFLTEMKQEKENNLSLFNKIVENDFVVKLKLPTKSTSLGEEEKWEYNYKCWNEIKCNINIIEDYIYIMPMGWESSYPFSIHYDMLDVTKFESYINLKPNYKKLFFKININDVKFYKNNGTIYANTSGNINSKYSVGSLLLTGDSTYKTKGTISTNLKDNRSTELYYNDNGIIRTLIFDGETLTKLQLIMPEKEKI